MSKRFSILGVGLLVVSSWLGGAIPAGDKKEEPAVDPVKEKIGEEQIRKAETVGLAYRLADYGRAGKSPDALLVAASMLRKFKADPSAATFKIADSKDKEAAPLKTGSYLAESDNLLAEARKLSEELIDAKVKDPSVNPATKTRLKQRHADLLARAAEVEEGSRGLTTGPNLIIRDIAGGGSETYQLAFIPGQPATLVLNADRLDARMRLSLRDPLGRAVATSRTGPNAELLVFPGSGVYNLTITNLTPGGRVVTYRLIGN